MTQDTKDKQPHTPQNTTNLAKKGTLKLTKPNFTHHIPGEIAHIPGLDTPKLHFLLGVRSMYVPQ